MPQSGSSSKRGIKTVFWEIETHNYIPRVGHPAKEGLRLLCPFLKLFNVVPERVHPAKEGLTMQCFSYFFKEKSAIRDAMHRDFFNPYHVFYKRSRIRSVIYCVSINHYPSCTSTNMMYLVFTIHL